MMGSCPKNWKPSFLGSLQREIGDLKIISPQGWACGVSLPNANASSCATQGSWQNACPTLNPAEFGPKHYPRPTPFAACSWYAGSAKGKGCSYPIEGRTRKMGLISLKKAEKLLGGGVKKIALPSAVKRGIIGASGRRLLCHLAYSISRKSHLVIRRRGGKRSNQTPIQAPFSDSPCWLGWSHLTPECG